jgi:hypothetical protein
MTTPSDDYEPGVESRLCAVCGHDEDEHELVDLGASSRGVCRACDDAHDFEPELEA